MGELVVNTPSGDLTFTIAGDQPTVSEAIKIKNIIEERGRQSGSSRVKRVRRGRDTQTEQLFDTKSGIQNATLRAALSAAETDEEQELQLQKLYGLGEGDYTRDNRGRLAITTQGGEKLGMNLEKDTLIDEEGFSRYDFADLASLVPDIGGGVAGTLKGAAIGSALFPGIGTFIGGVIGAGVGTATAGLLEESAEKAFGVSSQTAGEIAKDAGVNFLIGAGSEFAIGGAIKIVAPFVKGMKPATLPDEDLMLAGQSIRDFDIDPSIGAIGGSQILARQQKIGEKVWGGSPRLKKNYDSMMNTINGYKSKIGVPVGQVSEDEAGRVLIASIASKDAALKNAEREAKESIINTFENIAVDLGAAAAKDENLNESVFLSLSQAIKNFDEMAATKYASIDAVLKDTVGNAKIIDTQALKGLAKQLADEQVGAIAASGLSEKAQSAAIAAKAVIDGFQALPKKASFTQIYNTRKELFDASFAFRGATGSGTLDDAVKLLDNLMTPATLENAASSATKPISSEGAALLTQAAEELPEARKFFRQGRDAIESMQRATGMRQLLDDVKRGEMPAKFDFLSMLVKDGKPEILNRTLRVVAKNVGADAAEELKGRLASEYLRDAVSKAAYKADDPLSFRGSSFANAIDDLGGTAKVLFGDNVDEIKNLANQIRQTTLPGSTGTADIESALRALEGNRAPKALVNTLRNLANAQEESLKAKKNTIFRKIADADPDATESAAQIISGKNASATNIKGIMNALDDTQKEQVRAFYMQNILQDFGSDVMIRGDALKKFAGSLVEASKGGKLQAIFGKEMGDDMTKFGKILEFNARTVEGGDLIAANIAASPLQNIGKLIRFSATGFLLSQRPVYKKVLRDYDNLKAGITPKERAAALGRIIASATVQTPGQLIQEGAETAEREIRNAMQNLTSLSPASTSGIAAVNVNQPLTPNPAPVQVAAPTTRTNVPVSASGIAGAGTNNLRQMATNNPAVAQALGIRGPTAGLL